MTYRTTSRTVASPSKLAGELLKSPTRPRTRARDAPAASGYPRGAFKISIDPFVDAADVFDKENAPLQTRSSRSRTASTVEPQKGKGKARAKAIHAVEREASSPLSRPTRRVLGDVNTQKNETKQPTPQPKPTSKEATLKNIATDDDSMVIDSSLQAHLSPDDTMPRASTPPPPQASPPRVLALHKPSKATQSAASLSGAISITDSDEDGSDGDSDADLHEEETGGLNDTVQHEVAEPTVTGNVVSRSSRSDDNTASFQPDINDTMPANDNTVSGTLIDPKLESARQAASVLLTSKIQQQKDANAMKPVKRTLASYGAKKSLPAAANNSGPSNVTTTIVPTSTPAGPGFRSSFLNKSLRKQIADQEALESGQDSDSDSDDNENDTGLVAGATFAAMYKKAAANTQANTRANAVPASNSTTSSKKRKSDEVLPAAIEASLSAAAPPHKVSKLGAAMMAAKTPTSAQPSTAKKAPAAGPASKLEQFRNNLAHVARSTGSGASASSASQSASSVTSPTMEQAPSAPLPVVKPSDAAVVPFAQEASALPSIESLNASHSKSSDSGSDSTEKLTAGTKSGESTIKASAIPRSPTRSPRAAATSPMRPPPRTGSVRKSPRKVAEQINTSGQESARSASPGPKVKESIALFQSSRNGGLTDKHTRSPTTQPRSLAALFGSPKQATKLPTLSATAGSSTTPAHSPPKNWQGSRLPFAQTFQLQQQALREVDKSLPQTPAEETADSQRVVSAASTVLSTSKAETAESQFFDARSRENSAEPADAPAPAPLAAMKGATAPGTSAPQVVAEKECVMLAEAPIVANKASSIVKTSSLSPKKVAAKALAKTGPTSPTKASSLRAAANATSPSKIKASARTAQQHGGPGLGPGPAPSGSPSRAWGIGEKIKGFLGLHASTTIHPSTAVAQTKVSASGTFQPRANGFATNTAHASASEHKTAATATPAPCIPGALLASPPPTAKSAQVNSTPSSGAASATANGKLTSIARAEMLRKKQAEEEERKAKDKQERRRMLMAKKEERAKAVAEEEIEKENRKRAREQNDRLGRSGIEDASIASSNGAPAAIPAALLGNIVVGGGGSAISGSVHSGSASSRTSTVSTVSSGPPTRPSSALNGSYAGVKSRYMQGAVQQQQQQPPPQQQGEESSKKRRVTNDKEGIAAGLQVPLKQQPAPQQSQGAPSARPGASVATSQIGAPKMVRTVSQSSIRSGAASQAAAQQQQQQQRTQPPPPIKLGMKPSAATTAAAGAGFGAAPRIGGAGATAGNGAATASMMANAGKAVSSAQPAAAKAMANANFCSSNPFQQAKQQQLQLQLQKQKQLQMQQQQQQQQQVASNAMQAQAAASAAAVRELELHRAAQLQMQMQNAAGGRYQEMDDDVAGDGDEVLPEIASEYSDSEDEETIQKRAAMPLWTQGDMLDAALLAQSTVDADEIFGIPHGPVELEKILPGERTANRIRRARTSSANWSGPDGLAQWEIDRYNKRMGIKSAGVQLHRDPSQPSRPAAMPSLSIHRHSISHNPLAPTSSTSSTAPHTAINDDARTNA